MTMGPYYTTIKTHEGALARDINNISRNGWKVVSVIALKPSSVHVNYTEMMVLFEKINEA